MRQALGVAAVLVGLALAETALAAAPAPASRPGETAVDELTVTAVPRRTRDRLVQSFISDYTTETPSGQITRWLDPICPQTVGMSDALNALVTQRVRQVAAMAGARVVADVNCTANMAIVFTPEPQAFLDNIRRKAPGALGYHFLNERTKVSRVKHPAQAWYATETETMNGVREPDSADDPPGFNGPSRPVPGVRLTNRTSSGLASALVVFDAKAIYGLEVGTLGDYAAMLGLSQTKSPERCKALVSIANLMSADCPADRKPKGITEADLAYLKALYAINPNLFANNQRNQIAFHMKKILDGR